MYFYTGIKVARFPTGSYAAVLESKQSRERDFRFLRARVFSLSNFFRFRTTHSGIYMISIYYHMKYCVLMYLLLEGFFCIRWCFEISSNPCPAFFRIQKDLAYQRVQRVLFSERFEFKIATSVHPKTKKQMFFRNHNTFTLTYTE